MRSPLLVRWPGRIEGGTKVAPIAAAIDLLPTLADLAGILLKTNKPLDGINLKSLLLGNKETGRSWQGFKGAFKLSMQGREISKVGTYVGSQKYTQTYGGNTVQYAVLSVFYRTLIYRIP